MYLPLGSTRLYAAEHETGGAETIIAMARSPNGHWLATLTASSLCVWSARQHRVVLGHYPRHPSSLDSDGSNLRLCWHPDSHTLAISTSGSFVYLYQVQQARGGSGGHDEHSSSLSADDCARLLHGQFHVSISLTQKVQAAVQEGAATGALATSSMHFWLGISSGVLLAIDWSAQDLTPRKLHMPVSPEEVENSQLSTPAAVAAVCCSASLGLVVGLDADGRVGYSFCADSVQAASHAKPLLLPSESGTALAINLDQRLLCVGCRSGSLLLFRIDCSEAVQRVTESSAPAGSLGTVRFERKLTLSPWGISPEECGAVVAIDWSDDGLGLAALWECRSRPGIWSPHSGACTFIPPANDLSAPLPSHASSSTAKAQRWRPMPRAVAWAENGLALWTALTVRLSSNHGPIFIDESMGGAGGGLLAEVVLVQPCASRGPCQSEAARRCFHAHDRVLILTQHNFVATEAQCTDTWDQSSTTTKAVSPVGTQFGWHELAVPWKYLADNWPVKHVSASEDGTQLAVSGTRGLTLLDLRTKRWRVFGDVTQERELTCVGLAWFRHIVIVYAIVEQPPAQENIWGDSSQQADSGSQAVQLHLYPRKHLDRSSRLFSPATLPAPPLCVDVDEKTGVLATLCKDGSLILHQLWLQRDQSNSAQSHTSGSRLPDENSHNREAMALRAVTLLAECSLDWAVSPDLGDLTVQKMRLAPEALVLPFCVATAPTQADTSANESYACTADDSDAVQAASMARQTRTVQLCAASEGCLASLCLMLFRGGQFELYDAISRVRLHIATNVIDFWLTPVSSLPFHDVTALPLVWYSDSAGRLYVCRAGDLAEDWTAAVAAHRADAVRASTTALQTSRVVNCWTGKQDASEAWTVGLSEHYGVLLRVAAPHWGSNGRPRGRDRMANGLRVGCHGPGLVIDQSPMLHHLLESLLKQNADEQVEKVMSTSEQDHVACATICKRCSPVWPSLSASLEWLLHSALETVGTKVKVPNLQGLHVNKMLEPAVGGEATLLASVVEVLRCFPQEFEGIVARCARTMDPAYWGPLFQEPPHGVGQPSLLFEACLQHRPPQLRNAAHYLIILQTTLTGSGASESVKWEDYPPRVVELALAAGEYKLATEVVQFLRRAETYANAAVEHCADDPPGAKTAASAEPDKQPAAHRGAFGRAPKGYKNSPPTLVQASSPAPADGSPGGGGWLEFLGFVSSSAPASKSAAPSVSMQDAEPEPQQDAILEHLACVEADHEVVGSNDFSLIQSRIVPLVEAHGLSLLQNMRLSDLVLCLSTVARTEGCLSDSEFDARAWLRRLYDEGKESTAMTVGVVEDFGSSLQQVGTMMRNDTCRQQELVRSQQPLGHRSSFNAATEACDEKTLGMTGASGAADSTPDTCALRELALFLAEAGWVDLALLLPTVCGDADGAAEILRSSAPQGYKRYDAYASGLLRFVLEQTQMRESETPVEMRPNATAEAERRVVHFLDRLTERSLPPSGAVAAATRNACVKSPRSGV